MNRLCAGKIAAFPGIGFEFSENDSILKGMFRASLSSRGLGHRVFIPATRVRIPMGMPDGDAIFISTGYINILLLYPFFISLLFPCFASSTVFAITYSPFHSQNFRELMDHLRDSRSRKPYACFPLSVNRGDVQTGQPLPHRPAPMYWTTSIKSQKV